MTFRIATVICVTALLLAAPDALAVEVQTPSPAGTPTQVLHLRDGERTVLTLVEGALPNVVSHVATDTSAIRAPQADTRVETAGRELAPPNSAAAGTFVATLRNFGPKGATLKVENGYDHPLIYDAVILVRHGASVVAERTSICPILAKGVSSEAWGQPLEGVAILDARTPAPGDLKCTGPNALAVTPPGTESNVCMGQKPGSPLAVRLLVDPTTGAVRVAEAIWTLAAPGSPAKGPMILLEYPMQGDMIGGRPVSLQVVAFAALQPPPTAQTASIALLADGRERAREPWGLFAQRRAQMANLPAGAQPIGFVGFVPFPRTDVNAAPDGFAALLADIGDGRAAALEARVIGNDGSVLGAKSYPLAHAPTADPAQVSAALSLAKAAAAAPGHCLRPPMRSAP